MNNPNEIQIAGTHYRTSFQHWDFAAMHFGPGYFKGQVTKYVTRWRKKNGITDLEKARHFLEKMISINWQDMNWPLHRPCPIDIPSYVRTNGLTPLEESVVFLVTIAQDVAGLHRALEKLNDLILVAAVEEDTRGEAGPSYTNQG